MTSRREILPTLDQLGIALVPFSPPAKVVLTGTVDTTAEFAAGDLRAKSRVHQDSRAITRPLLDLLTQAATAHDAMPAQVALVWLLTQRRSITAAPTATGCSDARRTSARPS